MMLEPVIMIAEWLRDANYGVNKKIQDLPLVTGHVRPSMIRAVLDPFSDANTAKGLYPTNTPSLIVAPKNPAEWQGTVMTADRTSQNVTVQVQLFDRVANSQKGWQAVHYTLRSIIRSLREWNKNDHAAARIRNEVQVICITSLQYGEVLYGEPPNAVVGMVEFTMTVRDCAP